MTQFKLRPKFLKVSRFPEGTLRVVPYKASSELAFEGPNREEIKLLPQLYGQFLFWGQTKNLTPKPQGLFWNS